VGDGGRIPHLPPENTIMRLLLADAGGQILVRYHCKKKRAPRGGGLATTQRKTLKQHLRILKKIASQLYVGLI